MATAIESIPSYESITFRPREALSRTSISSAVQYIEPTPRASETSLITSPPPFSAFGRPMVRHSYSMRALRLDFGSFASSPDSLPIFFTNSVVSGTLTWAPKSSEMPKSISVTIEGTLEHTSISRVPTHSSEGDTRNRKTFWAKTLTFYPTSTVSNRATFRAGSHVFPFEFSIPALYEPLPCKTFGIADEPESSPRRMYHLPPTFVERGFPYALQFAIVADVKRGALKLDHHIRALFRHVPVTLPSRSATALRLDAYRHNLVLPPPEFDLDGYSTTSAYVKGRMPSSPVSGGKAFAVKIQAFLPSPQEYPSGSPIHFFLKVSSRSRRPSINTSRRSSSTTSPSSPTVNEASEGRSTRENGADQEVLALLGDSEAIEVSLERVFHVDRSPVLGMIDIVSVAQLWRTYDDEEPHDTMDETSGRQEVLLQGEIVVRGPTMPNFEFPCLDLSYQIGLRFRPEIVKSLVDLQVEQLSSVAPTPESGVLVGQHSHRRSTIRINDGPGEILSVPIRLTNASRLGEPKPRSYAPTPSYE